MKKKPTTPSNADPSTSSGQSLRRLAEAKLSKLNKKKAATPTTKADIQRLVHELQVHQIELEMQNEELMQSKAELEWTLSQYAELYAFAPVGYFTLTRDGSIRRANLTGAKLLGLGLSDLIKRRFQVFVSPQSRTIFSNFLDKVFMSGNKQSCEVALQSDGPVPLWVRIEGICESPQGQNEMCYAIVSDIIGIKPPPSN
jgi:PAS domain-containing protein